jgi:hypothetical protein
MSNQQEESQEKEEGSLQQDSFSETCEICEEKISARNYALLQMRCHLHMRDHYIEKEKMRDRVKLVWNGTGWSLKTSATLP